MLGASCRRGGTSKPKSGQGGLVRVAFFLDRATCVPACVILFRVTGPYKGPITVEGFIYLMLFPEGLD